MENTFAITKIEKEIINCLNKGIEVFIENGPLNDIIIDYDIIKFKTHTWQNFEEEEITFHTTAKIFPKHIVLSDFENINIEYIKSNLLVRVKKNN